LNLFFFDAMHALPDRYLQLAASSFEFPCSDLPGKIRFVGPLPAKAADASFDPAKWLPLLRSGRPVVLVTQGTIANGDFSELLEPTIQALAEEDVTVIATLGTSEPRTLSIKIPDNTIVVPFVPFDKVMPDVSVFVTNGGYGSVNQALSNGVPLVVAGTTEDKAFVAARVGWSGAGIDLQTQRPSPQQVQDAVQCVLNQHSYRNNARRLAQDFARYNAMDNILSEIDFQLRLSSERNVLAYASR
jgi:UDP:flavonoid glycosyltransferase YjiC (YdhE family)